MTSLEVAPDNVDALVLLGEAQYNLGEPVNARKTALRALELAPNDVDVIELAAKTAFLAKDYEQAESLYQSLCTSDRDAKRRSRGLTSSTWRACPRPGRMPISTVTGPAPVSFWRFGRTR